MTHNDGNVEITVSVTTENTDSDGGSVVLRVDDDANGLPALDIEAVKAGEETPLNHAEGLALWCLEWTVTKSDGELLVAPNNATLKVQMTPSSAAA
ncbi:hypothetical protein [Halospeciosus flavus]|uniref:hypothetical protein n=1 Tax=Halospeciosus flavus TaxID=3032283 RepID=UPI003610C7F5